MSFIFERMVGVYIHYLQKKGYKVKEFAAISVVPRENQDIENLKNYEDNAYQKHLTHLFKDYPKFTLVCGDFLKEFENAVKEEKCTFSPIRSKPALQKADTEWKRE